MGDRNCKKMANYVPAAQFHPMFNQTITERRDYGAGGENRWSRQGPSNVVEGWHSGGAGIGMSYVRVGDRVIACGRGSEWGPGQRPRGTNYWDQAGARARRGYEWEPAKPHVQRGPTQEEIDAIVQRQIDATQDKVADLQARIAAMKSKMATATQRAAGGFDDNYGLGPEHGFGQRIYRCLVGGKGVAYRHSPKFENKDGGGHGPIKPQCVLADRICQGARAIFIRDARTKSWLPLSAPGAVSGMTTFEQLGMASGPNAIDRESMNIIFNDGSNKLDTTPESPGSKDPWFSPF